MNAGQAPLKLQEPPLQSAATLPPPAPPQAAGHRAPLGSGTGQAQASAPGTTTPGWLVQSAVAAEGTQVAQVPAD